jgi:cobalt-zinc-cadmium efflux system outer membrane protein
MRKHILMLIFILIKLFNINAQDEIPFRHYDISFKEYLDLVKRNNLEFAAEKLNISIAEAAVEASKAFNDPYMSFDMTSDSENSLRSGYGFSYELGKTIDLGGERKARIDLTQSEKEMTKALVADYLRNLQADATLFYLEAMKHRQLFMVRYNSYETMKKLAESDSIRFKLGSIMEIDAIQSKLETGILRNELIHAISEWKNSLWDISVLAGTSKNDTLFLPSSHLHDVAREFALNDLITEALNNRADLQAALLNKDVSQKALRLTKKERNTDIDIKAGFSNSYLIGGGAPAASGVTAGISLPLRFSNLYRGDIRMAEARIEQAQFLFEQAELKIRSEIMQAWEYYMDYCSQVENFNNGLLENAENVRKGKIYSYQRGETSLLEVLNAQRTYNDIQTTYYETRFNQAAALIQLEKAAGIWDINF